MKRSKTMERYLSALNDTFSSPSRSYRDFILNEQNSESTKFKIGDNVSFNTDSSAIPGKKVKKSGTIEKIEGDTLYIKGMKSKYGILRYKKKAHEVMSEEFVELDEANETFADIIKTITNSHKKATRVMLNII